MSFTIIISEKGGAERRETFDKNEINLGRVQGNDLMLPKGNVSKQHARLLFRDGRFIVTDLKSTNGTYVNGRKIAQATIVREGDKIYVGDFVLRLEMSSDSSVPPGPETPAGEYPAEGGVSSPPGASPSFAPARGHAPPQGFNGPPVPTRGGTLNLPPQRHHGGSGGPSTAKLPPPGSAAAVSVPAPPPARPSIPPRLKESPANAARRLGLVTLVDRVVEQMPRPVGTIDDAVRRRVEDVIRAQATAMRNEGEVPEGVDVDQLMRDATQELLVLGPIGGLLEDEDVLEIYCSRFDQLMIRRTSGAALGDVAFTSEDALRRVVERMASQVDPLRPGESIVERRLSRGTMMSAVLPPFAPNVSLTLRKRRRVEGAIEDLVRSGALSRAMGTFLENCVVARANILVVASSPEALYPVLGALASAALPGERMALLHDVEELSAPMLHLVALPLTGPVDEQASALLQTRADRAMMTSLGGRGAAVAAWAVAAGAEGLVAGFGAPSLRQGLARLVSQIVIHRSGTPHEAARECLTDTFDIALEVHSTGDGRQRVVRVAELAGTDTKGVVVRDLFTSVDSSEGVAFAASGVIPRILGEFAVRGVRVDPNLFKRSGRG